MSPEQATGMVEEVDHRTDQWSLACIAWEMLLGRGPFVADEVAALLYQIINLDPHPLAPRVPGLPPAVEPVLRKALSKRPTERFASMREFSRTFEAAAFGRPADATPTPVLVSSTPPPGATIAYGATPVPGRPAPSPAARTPRDANKPAARLPRDARKLDADGAQANDDSTQVLPRNRIKPILAISVAIGVLLLLGAFLLFRPGPAAKPVAPIPVQPLVEPLPLPPAPPARAAPEPTEAKPAVAAPSPARAKRAKWVDPFADGEIGKPKPTKATAPKSAQPKAKRKLIEEL
jgi:serine/threonine-protein kinase